MKYNFTAGPSIISNDVKKKLIEAINCYGETGLPIIELSHRSTEFTEIVNECKNLTKKLMNIGDDYDILFIPGGSSSQFHMIPMNILEKNDKALYLISGTWTDMASKQACLINNIDCIINKDFTTITNYNNSLEFNNKYKYVYITSNNTCYGTQYDKSAYPKVDHKNCFLVADMCSDIMSREIDHTMFDLIHASIQKNLGISGITIVVIRKSLLDNSNDLPAMLCYKKQADWNSVYNTSPVISIYSCLLTLRWINENGGLKEIEKKNIEKANILYNYIDNSSIFHCYVKDKKSRSIMNITFYMNNREEEKKFLNFASSKDIVGIKYHPSVGKGFRVSLYNALPITHVEYLINIMSAYENQIINLYNNM